MATQVSQFVRDLYFDLQTIEGVRPIEIWSGLRELSDPYEKTALVKNLYKIVIPLVNETCFGRPFETHSLCASQAVSTLLAWYSENPDAGVFHRFPYPPMGESDQKELYRMVRARAQAVVAKLPVRGRRRRSQTGKNAGFPDSLFDFREMRVIDNELPYIIFTDKEFRVIHGLALVYLWLIDLDKIFTTTLGNNGVDPGILEEYKQIAGRLHRDNPFALQGWNMEPSELPQLIRDRLDEEDYLDVFESIYRWFEQAREKLRTA